MVTFHYFFIFKNANCLNFFNYISLYATINQRLRSIERLRSFQFLPNFPNLSNVFCLLACFLAVFVIRAVLWLIKIKSYYLC